MSDSFGDFFQVTTFGESRSKAVGAIIEGCPAGMELTEKDIQIQLDRRRPGANQLVTSRQESDVIEILSGTENGITCGSPITLLVKNKKIFLDKIALIGPRPSHADFSYYHKYGRIFAGGGRASARETLGRVAAGAIAEKILRKCWNIRAISWVSTAGKIRSEDPDFETISRELVDESIVRCPDRKASENMVKMIGNIKEKGDSVGGTITCVVKNVPGGWGEPVFDGLDAKLAQAMLSIPACKGFEMGYGFLSSQLHGSEYNDPYMNKNGKLYPVSNRSGGVLGGVSSGEIIWFKVAFKPAPTISRSQKTASWDDSLSEMVFGGQNDPFIPIRAVPIVECMTSLVLLDLAFAQEARIAISSKIQNFE